MLCRVPLVYLCGTVVYSSAVVCFAILGLPVFVSNVEVRDCFVSGSLCLSSFE